MFRIKTTIEPVKWPVWVPIPVDGGTVRRRKFVATFQRFKQSELDELGKLEGRKFLDKILVGAEEIEDENHQPIPFGPELLNTLYEDSLIRGAIVAAYWEMLRGIEAKNS